MKLRHNIHLKLLTWLPRTAISSFSHFSLGQSYTDLVMNIYKQPGGLVLTSFELFNCGICSFQQLPWIANVNGIPVWSQSGGGAESISGFGITNTHNPYIKQRENVSVISHST